MTLVSILVPAYNAAGFLEETVRSVLAQTHREWELLLIDDGSTDATPALLGSLSRLDPRIRTFRQENAGTQAARNFGLRHARGDWVALLDHDDLWLPRKLERQLEIAREHPGAELLFCNFSRWNGERELDRHFTREDRLPSGAVLEKLARHCLFGALTVLVRRDALSRAGGFDTRFLRCGDWDLWLRLAEQGVEARGTLEVLALWRVWEGNLSGSVVKMRREEVLVLEAALERALTDELRSLYRRALAEKRGNLALHEVLARSGEGYDVATAAWHAWRLAPKRVRLLEVALSSCWPRALGGARLRARALAKIRRSY